MEEIDDLLQGFLGFVLTGHILKGDAGLLFHVDLGLALAEGAHHAVAAHPLGDGAHEQKQHGEHHHIIEDGHNHGIVFHNGLVDRYTGFVELLSQLQMIGAPGDAGEAGPLHGGVLGGLRLGHVNNAVIADLHLCQLTGFLGLQKIGEGSLGILAVGDGIIDPAEQQHQSQGNDHCRPDLFAAVFIGIFGIPGVLAIIFHIWYSLGNRHLRHHSTFFRS